MQSLPHRYSAAVRATPLGEATMESRGLSAIATAKPAEFDGPGDRWSPETLLVGAVADCFVLTFRGIAARVRLPWTGIRCHVDGTLDRVDRVTRFTRFDVRAEVEVPEGVETKLVHEVLERAEATCLITRSLVAESHLDMEVFVSAPVAVAV
jgi:organic hydroperoxide reductase OsmC/OhrA